MTGASTGSSDDEVWALSIGVILGGMDPVSRRWRTAAMSVTREGMEIRETVVSPIRVNVILVVAGDVSTPAFEGVRLGRFDRKAMAQIVQVAILDTEVEDRVGAIHAALRQALAVVEDRARKRHLVEDLHELWALLDELERRHRDRSPD